MMKPMDDLPIFLRDLNAAQLEAVVYPPNAPLQILAGPGSGKTKVLTCRVAHMIRAQGLNPARIWALTFSNKAANEMRHRLSLLGVIGIQTGTFHSVCAGLLRKHARLVGLLPNFTICDADESKKIISAALDVHRTSLSELGFEAKEGHIQSLISRAKSRGNKALLSDPYLNHSGRNRPQASPQVQQILQGIYDSYETALRTLNGLDFDDLLVFGVKLLKDNQILELEHLFIDEFQDTSILQLEIMNHMAPHGCLTIVGDPDQSIYGWRSAETANLNTMITMFPSTKRVLLEANYRSTAPILRLSYAIISQDTQRITRSLRAAYEGSPPVWNDFVTEQDEATYMANEIKRLALASGGLLKYDDFAILLRISSLSRAIEGALHKQGIPNRVLGGHKFFDRLEIKDILAYLTLIVNPLFEPAWSRCVQRIAGVGEKTRADLLLKAKQLKLSPLEVIERVRDGKLAVKPASLRASSATFVDALRTLRTLAAKGTSPADLIRQLLVLLNYGAALKKSHKDWEARIENINELISFAQTYEDQGTFDNLDQDSSHDPTGNSSTPSSENAQHEAKPDLLRSFLERATLSTDILTSEDANIKTPKVTIATCHSAKGLEWGVVMIPAVESGIYPSYRSDDHDEERRLLYVACTRAQGLLYLSRASKRMVNGTIHTRQPSDFLKPILKQNVERCLVSTEPASTLTERHLQDLAKVLRRSFTSHHAAAAADYEKERVAEITNAEVPVNEAKFMTARGGVPQAPLQEWTPSPHIHLLPRRAAVVGIYNRPPPVSKPVSSYEQRPGVEPQHKVVSPSSDPTGSEAPSDIAGPTTELSTEESNALTATIGKRRLGMGRTAGGAGTAGGYQNKRFKPITISK